MVDVGDGAGVDAGAGGRACGVFWRRTRQLTGCTTSLLHTFD